MKTGDVFSTEIIFPVPTSIIFPGEDEPCVLCKFKDADGQGRMLAVVPCEKHFKFFAVHMVDHSIGFQVKL